MRRNGWWDGEVKAALDARKAANRQHRAAVTAALPSNVCQDLWDQYLACKRTMQQVVQRKIATHDHAQLRSMTAAGRQGGRKFWAYVSTLDRKPAPPEIRDETTGEPVSDIPDYLTRHMAHLYDPALPTATEEHYAMSAPESGNSVIYECKWQVSRLALDRALARIDSRTAQGLDAIPAGLVKTLGDIARDNLAHMFTEILSGEPVPADWQCGRVCLIHKKGGDAGLIQDYRPITVTSVLYRLFTTVVKSWLRAWAERSGALTELQNGFRSDRRLEDNLFTLSQTIDLARKESRGLVACFLDVAKAYDSVPHEPMLSRMSALNMPPPLVDMLRRLYKNNTVVACLGGAQSLPVPVRRGLKQGCPLSPLLYMLYVSGLERSLIDSRLGFPFRFLSEGLPDTWVLPGLADDLVLLAETVVDLQRLVTHLARLGLSFNPKKSAVIQFSGRPEVKCGALTGQ